MQKMFMFELKYLFQLKSKLEKLIDEGYHIEFLQIAHLAAFRENDYEALVIVSKEES